MNGKVFFGGIPTDVEVRALREKYPEAQMQDGQVIRYEDVERVIECKKGTSRWSAITGRWRKTVERETGRVVIGAERGVGFKVLNGADKIDLSESKLASSARAARRSYRVTATVEIKDLTEEERDRLMWAQKRGAAVLATMQIKRIADLPSLTGEGAK